MRRRGCIEEVRDAVALAVEFDGERVAELGPVVAEDHGEHLAHDGEASVLSRIVLKAAVTFAEVFESRRKASMNE